jgi:hypothetical protein
MNLRELQASHGITSDKDTTHSYLEVYDEVLAPYRNKHVEILEIGNAGGESIRLWDAYFEFCDITGIELEPFSKMDNLVNLTKEDHINVYDDTNAYCQETFDKFKHRKFDIIIDDGSHMPKDMVFAINNWYELLKDNGLMVIEDVQGSHLAQPIIDQSAQFFVKMNAQIVDRTHIKGRFDDILIIIKRGN